MGSIGVPDCQGTSSFTRLGDGKFYEAGSVVSEVLRVGSTRELASQAILEGRSGEANLVFVRFFRLSPALAVEDQVRHRARCIQRG